MSRPAPQPAAVDASAVDALATRVHRLEVWPGCWHAMTRAERAVVASTPFQRLRRLRQMGLAFHAWPNAENTRASHSLGVACWAAGHVAALQRCPDPATQAILAHARTRLAPLPLDLVVRLFALLHDIDLLPLGHTLRYQSGAFAEAGGRPRLAACVAAIQVEARDAAFHDAPSAAERQRWLAAFEALLAAAADALSGAGPGPGRLPAELVNSGLGADLIDFALHDSAAIHRPQRPPADVHEHLRLVEVDGGVRLALALGGPQTAPARVALADGLYRARHEIFAASVFHPVKLAADAMLDGVLRRLDGPRRAALLPEARLLAMGDDELLDVLVAAEEAQARDPAWAPLARWLRQGRLHEEVWRTADLDAFRRRPDSAEALGLDPHWRSAAERRLLAHVPGAAEGDVLVAVSPPAVQAKPAGALLCGEGGVFSVGEARAHGFDVSAPEIAARHAGLWSLRVCVSERCRADGDRVRRAADSVFGGEA